MNEIQLPVSELKTALTGLGKVISKTSSLPVLSCVRVNRNSEGEVSLTGTDLDSFVTTRLKSKSEGEPLTCLVPFGALLKVTKNCGGGDHLFLGLRSKDQIAIRYPAGNTFIEAKEANIPVEEFPPLPVVRGESVVLDEKIQQSVLEAFQCIPKDETRYVLRGACLDVSNKTGHSVVGTDGRHLYAANSFKLDLKDSLIIPNRKFLEWGGFQNDGEWKLTVSSNKKDTVKWFGLESAHWSFASREIDGVYPNWRQVVPDHGDVKVQIEFGNEAVSILANILPKLPGQDHANQPVGLFVENQKLRILAHEEQDKEETVLEIPDVKIKGMNVQVAVNRAFFIKALQFGFRKVNLIDEHTPLIFVTEGKRMVVMPVRYDGRKMPENAVDVRLSAKPTNPEPVEPEPMKTENRISPASGTTTVPVLSEENPTALKTAITQIEIIKESFKEAVSRLSEVLDSLKVAVKEQKTAEKEVEGIRTTLKNLQKFKL